MGRLAASAPAELTFTSRLVFPPLPNTPTEHAMTLPEEAEGMGGEEGKGEEEEGVMCAICHGNIQPNEVALVNGCDHPFCSLCILNWATQKARCPLCLTNFTHVWLYRRIDGTYNDYLHEESVDLLHCAVWFKKGVTAEFQPSGLNENEEEEEYHEMLQWMYVPRTSRTSSSF